MGVRIPLGLQKGEIRAVWTKLGALEMRRPSRCLGSSPSFSAMDSKLGRFPAPPGKRVARQRVGFDYSALRNWKMNCSGLQVRLESGTYPRVLGSTPTSSANWIVNREGSRHRLLSEWPVFFGWVSSTLLSAKENSKLLRLFSIK